VKSLTSISTLKKAASALMVVALWSVSTLGRAGDATEATKTCFNCSGTGKTTCREPNCSKGERDCTGPCLKLSRGAWIHKNVAGHSAIELWQEFRGNGKTKAWNHHHVGEVIQMQNGDPVNIGKCTVCSGTARVACSTCQGKSEARCYICEGKKKVPSSWSAFDHPKMKTRPADIHFKDGRIIRGRITMQMGNSVWITTKEGRKIEALSSDIVPK
jgi:hypothetical protein